MAKPEETENSSEPGQNYQALRPDKIDEDLQKLFLLAVEHAQSAATWYTQKRSGYKRRARAIRFISIVLFSAAGLVPVLLAVGVTSVGTGWITGNANESFQLGQLGYLFAAIAAAFLGYDKFSGFSTGWVRYILAEMDINKRLVQFRLDWVTANSCLDEDAEERKCGKKRLQLIRDFSLAIETIVAEETKVWVAEFQSALSGLEKAVRQATEAQMPGSLQVKIEKGKNIKTVKLLVDGNVHSEDAASSEVIAPLAPGIHVVEAIGTDAAGKQIKVAASANITAGGEASIPLKVG